MHGEWVLNKQFGTRADLSRADLSRADLSRADLSRADLSRADLSRADLSRADLSRADLSRADLSRADLSRADLSRADLWNLTGNRLHIKTISLEKYMVTYTHDCLQIGCRRHTFEEWMNFDDDEIECMDLHALAWWKKWKETIFKLIEMSPAIHTKNN